MVKVYCNKCRKELEPNKWIGYISLQYKMTYKDEPQGDNPYKDMHYCPDCINRVKKFLDESPTEKPAEHDENAEISPKQPQTVSEPQEKETNKPQELFRVPKDVIKPPETKTTRKRIDYGKIMALHNAGWSNQKIADEMGMTYAAVATAISTYKKKMGGGKEVGNEQETA